MESLDLVTGGTGFVGSHLVKRLSAIGHRVRVFDIDEGHGVPPGVDFVKGDMRDSDKVAEAVEGVTTIYHLAFIQVFSCRPEREKWDINYGGTKNFISAALEAGVGRFVHTSTIEVYSPRPPFRAPEDAPTDRPFGWYGKHKKACEELCLRYHRQAGLPVVIVRLPNICGRGYYARMDLLRAFDYLMRNLPPFWFSGPPMRGDFVWIDDAVQGYVLCGTVEGIEGEIFNISCSEPSTAIEFIESLQEVAGNTRKIRRIPLSIARPIAGALTRTPLLELPPEQLDYIFYDNSYSIEKAARMLGYSPRKNAAEAAAELMRGYLQNRERAKERARKY